MRKLELILPATALCAVREFAAVQDVRYYLKGVLLEHGPGGTVLAATDGAVLGAYQVAPSPDATDLVQIIIPLSMLKGIKPRASAPVSLRAEEREPAEAGGPPRWWLTLSLPGGVSVSDYAVDGRFPDWRRVVPRTASGEVTHQFNPSLMAKFQRAAAALAGKPYRGDEPVSFGFNGERALVRVPADDAFVGVGSAWKAAPVHVAPVWVHS